MHVLSSIKTILFCLLLSCSILQAQDAYSDSLQHAILSYSWYHPTLDSLIDALEKNEQNQDFLLENIGLMAETEDGITLPIINYLSKHKNLISLGKISNMILVQQEDLEIIFYLLDSNFDDMILYLRFLDDLLCETSIHSETQEKLESKRQEIFYKYRNSIPFVDDTDKSFFLFELKEKTDVKSFTCLLKQSFPDFYDKASYIVDVNKGMGNPLICVSFEQGTIIAEKPYRDYVIRMNEIGYCNFRNLLMKYRP